MFTVEQVHTKAQMRAFIRFPWTLYKEDPYWVPPLIAERRETLDVHRNPFFQNAAMELFIVRSRGAVAGRIAAIRNDIYRQIHDREAGFFGFFECVNNGEAAAALFSAASDWLRTQGCTRMQGPVSPSTNYECGLLVEGFNDSPRFLMPYNPAYYAMLVKEAGFTVARQLLAYKLWNKDILNCEKIRHVAEAALARQKLNIRSVNMAVFADEIRTLCNVYNKAWSDNWGFTPMTDAEASFMARRLKMIVEPSLVLLAEVQGIPAGVGLVLPDFNRVLRRLNGRLFPLGWLKFLAGRKHIEWLRLLLIGVTPEFRHRGLEAAVVYALAENSRKLGIHLCEGSWVLEDNVAMNRIMQHLGAPVYKRLNLYEKVIS